MLTPNGGVFGRNPTFNNVTVENNLTVNGDFTLGDDIVINDTLLVNGVATFRGGIISIPNSSAPTSNTVLGSGAGAALQSGAIENVFVGINSGQNTTTGDGNVSVGGFSTTLNTTSSSNTAVGTGAFYGGTGSQNVALGREALQGQTGNNATAVGFHAARNSSASDITAVGARALFLNTASDITAVGANALDANTTGTNNTAVGKDALGANTTGTTNIAIGNNAMGNNTTGSSNVVIGWNAGAASTTSLDTAVVIGHQAGSTTSVGNTNTLVGGFAGHAQTSFSVASTAVGYAACFSQGGANAALGASAGYLRADGTIGTGCNSSVFIGQDSRPAGDSQTNQIVIGQGSRGNGSNTTTIGNSSTTGTFIPAGNLTLSNGSLTVKSTSGTGTLNVVASDNDTMAFEASSGFNQIHTFNNNNPFYISAGAADIILRTATNQTRMTVGNDGNISIANGNLVMSTSGKGIDFSATANSSGTMTSELLSDYEEGTWTPDIRFGGGSVSMTYTTREANYTKVGRQVTIRGFIELSNKGTSTGAATLSNLPFTAIGFATGSVDIGNVTFADRVVLTVSNATTNAAFNETTNAGARTGLTDADFTNTSLIIFTLTYFT